MLIYYIYDIVFNDLNGKPECRRKTNSTTLRFEWSARRCR